MYRTCTIYQYRVRNELDQTIPALDFAEIRIGLVGLGSAPPSRCALQSRLAGWALGWRRCCGGPSRSVISTASSHIEVLRVDAGQAWVAGGSGMASQDAMA